MMRVRTKYGDHVPREKCPEAAPHESEMNSRSLQRNHSDLEDQGSITQYVGRANAAVCDAVRTQLCRFCRRIW